VKIEFADIFQAKLRYQEKLKSGDFTGVLSNDEDEDGECSD